MAVNNLTNYINAITPIAGDSTYSVLKAHLLFEELLRAYLARTLPHHQALEGARLTFLQLLAVARASSTHMRPDDLVWKAIADLNKLRNMLSHESQPKAMAEKTDAYVDLVIQLTGVPLPQVGSGDGSSKQGIYRAVDVVTTGLYYRTAASLGFKVDNLDNLFNHPQPEGSTTKGPQ